jgi:hypothetical protein
VIEGKQILRRLKELKDVVPEGTTVEDLIEKAQERESSQGSPVRKQIGVHMDLLFGGDSRNKPQRSTCQPVSYWRDWFDNTSMSRRNKAGKSPPK